MGDDFVRWQTENACKKCGDKPDRHGWINHMDACHDEVQKIATEQYGPQSIGRANRTWVGPYVTRGHDNVALGNKVAIGCTNVAGHVRCPKTFHYEPESFQDDDRPGEHECGRESGHDGACRW